MVFRLLRESHLKLPFLEFSRLVTKISESSVLQNIQQQLIQTAMAEGFIQDDTIAIDATHIEARDQAPPKDNQPKPEPKKRVRKPKAEHEAWLKQKQREEEQKTKKDIAAQLDESYKLLRDEMPQDPHWGVKKNSKGKNVFWYGYKGHLVVGAKSQYILGSVLFSGNLNDGKAAIPLLKGLAYHFPDYTYRHATLDAGYDYEPIYRQIRKAKAQSNIAYKRRRESELEGFDEHFAPT